MEVLMQITWKNCKIKYIVQLRVHSAALPPDFFIEPVK